MNHVTEQNYPQSAVTPTEPLVKRISWGAVLAGLITALIIQLLLTLLGMGIGAATVEPLREHSPAAGLGVGAAVWFFLSSVIAMYVGGRVAGRFSGSRSAQERMLHGVLTWATATILSAIFLASAAGSLLGGAASLLGSAAATSVQTQQYQTAGREPGTILSPTGREGVNEPANAQNEQKARAAGDVAARRVSRSALWSSFVLVFCGLGAAVGGRTSTVNNDGRSTRERMREHRFSTS